MKPQFRRLLRLEPLEDRCLLAALPTLTSLSAPATALVGQPLQFTASVTVPGSMSAATPSGGSVTFKDGNVVLGTAPVVAGQASLVNSVFVAGGQAVTASYSGDGSAWAGSTSAGVGLQVSGDSDGSSSFAMPCYEGVSGRGITPATGISPAATSSPVGMTPTQIRQAYGTSSLTFGSTAANGAGTTIAIVDAYDDPNIASDLASFDSAFSLPAPPSFTKVNQTGGTTYPAANSGWITEIALDVEWAHAVAPGASILLVEANSNSNSDLFTAVNYARNAAGVVAVSMSWSGGEFSGETADDSSYFTTPTGHAGVTFLAATGDDGAPSGYPAISPNVVAVGGTTLTLSGNNYGSESGWSGSGGGISTYESQPSYQSGVVTQSATMRTNPDVSYDADPNTGFPVYDSYNNGTTTPWGQWGGTSDATPQWAALVAIVDQGRALTGQSSLDGRTQTLPLLYSAPSTDYHDVTTGTSTGAPNYTAGPGYDLVTGIGTPQANKLVLYLAGLSLYVSGSTPSAGAVVSTPPTSFTVTFNEAVNPSSLQAGALTVNGTPATGVSLSAGDTIATFTYGASPVTSQGLETMAMAAGSVTQLGNASTGLMAFSSTFRYDALLQQVTTTNPAVGSTFNPGPLTLDVSFNEAVAPASVSTSSLSLSGIAGATVSSATVLAGNTTVAFAVSGINSEGTLTASIAAGGVTDAYGNPCAAFSGTYTVDVGVEPFPTALSAAKPLGSLVYTGSYGGAAISPAADTDSYTLALDAGEVLTSFVTPAASLQPVLSLNGPAGTTLATATAPGAGQQALVQTVSVATTGTYTLTVSSAGGTTGSYTLQVDLNTAVGNGTGTTTALDGSYVSLPAQSDRYAVMGSTNPTLAATASSITTTFAGGNSQNGNMFNLTTLTHSITVTSLDVDLTSTGSYNLVLYTRTGGYIGYETNSSAWTEMASATVTSAGSGVSTLFTVPSFTLPANTVTGFYVTCTSGDMNYTNGNNTYTNSDVSLSTGIGKAYPFGTTYSPRTWNGIINYTVAKGNGTPDVQSFTLNMAGKAGHVIDVALAGQSGVSFAGEQLQLLGTGNTVLATATPTPLGNGVTVSNYDLGILNYALPAGGVYTLRLTSSQTQGAFELAVTDDVVLDTEPNNALSNTLRSLDQTSAALGYLSSTDTTDIYAIDLTAGQFVTATATTPFDTAGGLPDNVLVPALTLYNPAGNQVATASGNNTPLEYATTTSGTYHIAVSQASGAGEYDLSLQQAALGTAAATLTMPSGSTTYGGTLNLSATLLSGSTPVAGELIGFDVNNHYAGTVTTNANGVATLTGVSSFGSGAGTDLGYLTANFAGDATYVAANATANLTVNKATLAVTAGNATRVYAAPDPLYSATYSGFVNGDVLGNSGVSGNPVISSGDTAASPAGNYAITPGLGTLTAANYTFSFANGTLSITPASTATTVLVAPLAVVSSQTATLAATVTALSPSTGTPTGGNVTFYANGTAVGSAVLSGGTATLTTAALNLGSDLITATYAGDGLDFQGSSYAGTAPAVITTLAGGSVGDGGPASAAFINSPYAVAADAAGDIFIADYGDNRIREVNAATGVITTIAGTGTAGYSGDGGQATAAMISDPMGIAVDTSGNAYFSDPVFNRIRKINMATGVITTVAGNGTGGFGGDGGPATAAEIYGPEGLAIDSSGDIYIADYNNHRVREVLAATGNIVTVAGNGTAGYSGDGAAATAAEINNAPAVAVDAAGDLYIADGSNFRVREVNASGIITTVAGNGSLGDGGDGGPATAATLGYVSGVAIDGSGNLYVSDSNYSRVRKISGGMISPFAGESSGYSGDGGPATAAAIDYPQQIAVDAHGNVYFADQANNAIRRVNTAGIITTVAGGTVADNGPASAAYLNRPYGVAVDDAGNVYVADTADNRVREINRLTGVVTTVAGNGISGFNGDGTATSCELASPQSVALDAFGNLYIADNNNQLIRKVNLATGVMTTVAGNGNGAFSGDGGPATLASLDHPQSIAVDGAGDLFIADMANFRVREVNAVTGNISTVAGNGTDGYSGDGGAATAAEIGAVYGMAVDASGNLLISDSYNYRVRRVTPGGVITTFAGNGTSGFSGNGGPATAAELNLPTGLAFDAAGNLYIADASSQRVREVAANGTIATFAGNGAVGVGGDGGPPTAAALDNPYGVAVDAQGDVIIADTVNNRIREVTAPAAVFVGGTAVLSLSTPASVVYGGKMSVSATLAVGGAPLAGWPVSFSLHGASLGCAVTAANGVATLANLSVAGNNAGTYASFVMASSAGEWTLTPAAAAANLVVTPACTATSVTASPTSLNLQQATTLAATVAALSPSTATPTGGNVTFYANGNAVGSGTLSGGTATLVTAALGTGSYVITAAYAGDGLNFLGGNSVGNVSVTVSSLVNTTLSTACSTVAVYGGSLTLSATLLDGSSPFAGQTVAFSLHGNSVGTALTNANGVATLGNISLAGTNAGSYASYLTASYAGNAAYAASSAGGNLSVSAASTATVLSESASAIGYGQALTLTANVTALAPSTATPGSGNVSFYDNGAPLGCAAVSGGTATLTTTSLAAGTYLFTATYAGDGLDFLGSTGNLGSGPVINSIAGTGSMSFSGDGGPASSAGLFNPTGAVVDAAGNVYIADQNNYRVREINAVTGKISTIAGNGSSMYSGDGGQATAAAIGYPTGLALDSSGNLYIADEINDVIRKVNLATGIITTVAGSGSSGYSGDGGPATAAKMDFATGVAVDAAGDVFIADEDNSRIREVNAATGIITTVAGTGSSGYNGDGGQATAANLYWPTGVAVDSSGNLYIADQLDERVRKVNAVTHVITTVAGNGSILSSGGSGTAVGMAIGAPTGVALDASGDLFIVDNYHCYAFEVNAATGVLTTLAGTGSQAYGGDGGPATAAALDQPFGIAVDSSGDVFIADQYNERVRKITPTQPALIVSADATTLAVGTVGNVTYGGTAALSATLLAGATPAANQTVTFTLHGASLGSAVTGANGVATLANISLAGYGAGTYASYLGASFAGNANYVASSTAASLVVNPAVLTVAAANASRVYGAANPALSASYNGFVNGDTLANAVTGSPTLGTAAVLTSPAGNYPIIVGLGSLAAGNYAFSLVNGNLTVTAASTALALSESSASIAYGQPLTLTANVAALAPATLAPGNGNVAFYDSGTFLGNGVISGGTATLTTTSLALGGHWFTAQYAGDGLDYSGSAGNLGVAPVINTVAGNGSQTFSGDGGPATAAGLSNPTDAVVDAAGNVYIADQNNGRIREINAVSGKISTSAGNGSWNYSGDGGQATAAAIGLPAGLALSSSGNLYFADNWNNVVRQVNLATGVITTVAGDGTSGYSGDGGPATAAELNGPASVAVDAAGDVFIADEYNERIREVNAITGNITTVAGTGSPFYTGDGGPATAATFWWPDGVALDSAGNLYIADRIDDRVREVNAVTQIVTTVAGNGSISSAGGSGPATAMAVGYPIGLAVDAAGDLFVTDQYSNYLDEVNAATGTLIRLAGNGTSGYGGDGGLPTAAMLHNPDGIAVDSAGDVFVVDQDNQRVRKITPATPALNVAADVTSLTVGTSGSVTYGGAATLTATLLSGGTALANASVTFSLNGTTVGTAQTNAAGVATLAGASLGHLGAGTYAGAVSAVFGGSPDYLASSASGNLTVGQAPLTVTVNNTAKTYGSSDPTFTFTYAGLAAWDTPAALGGTLSVTTTEPGSGFAPVGTYQLTGSGLSSANYSITYPAGTLTVTPAATAITVGTVAPTVIYGQALTLTATVAAAAPSAATPTGGTVTFLDGSTTLGTAPLAGGSASLGGLLLAAGSHDFTARYSGDGADFSASWIAVGPASTVTTLAGTTLGDGTPATAAVINAPYGVLSDAAGDLFIADTSDNRIREVVKATGTIITIAGTGTAGYSGDGGQATAAQINAPNGMAWDASGNLYFADRGNNRVREINLVSGVISTVAGTGGAGYGGDGGPATAALLNSPSAVAIDQAGDIFIADSSNSRVREVVAATGNITTLAGNGTWGYSGDGAKATAAELEEPLDLALDSSGDLYVSDWWAKVVRKIVLSTGVISTVAGNGGFGIGGNGGPATAANFFGPTGLAVDAAGNLYIADSWAQTVREVNAATGMINAFAGNGAGAYGGAGAYSGDGGPAVAAELNDPEGLAIDARGNLDIADTANNRIRTVNLTTGIISTAAGSGGTTYAGDGAAATMAVMDNPQAVAVDAAGDLFVADTSNNRVREVNHVTGTIATIAGNGAAGYSGDGHAATAAELSAPAGVALDGSGDLFIADTGNNRIREVNLATGVITTVAGTGSAGFGGDGGPATAAALDAPRGVAVDGSGNLLIADTGDNRIRKINAVGVISTLAGDGSAGFSGDGGPATAAALNGPRSIAIDASGDLYIADDGNNRVREVNAAGTIVTVAGNGTAGYEGDGGAASAAELSGPDGVAVDAAGDLFIADGGNNRVREVVAGNGIISTAAGTAAAGFSGDGGAATAAAFAGPAGLAVDAAGNLYVADAGNNRVRCVGSVGGSLLVIAPATLTVTPRDASRTYGAADPAYTATIAGLVNGDSLAAVVSGSPSFTSSDTAASPAGAYAITAGLGTLQASPNYTFAFASGTLTVYSAVAGRDIFYANSSYNGNIDTACAADDNAIDTSKSALLPGQTATFANYTDSTPGINGIMVDVAGLANPAGLTAADFQFLVGNDSTPSDWTSLTVAPTVTVRVGAGTGGSDRVELIWPDNTIRNEWLQVTVLADANTGLAANDVFYFGAEPGAVMGNGYVSFDDIFAVYRTILAQLPTVTAATAADVNHDGMINFDDIFAVYRAILANNDFTLNMITAPATPADSPAATTALVAPTASVAADTTTPAAAPVATPTTSAAADTTMPVISVVATAVSASTTAADTVTPADAGSQADQPAGNSLLVDSAPSSRAVAAATPLSAAPSDEQAPAPVEAQTASVVPAIVVPSIATAAISITIEPSVAQPVLDGMVPVAAPAVTTPTLPSAVPAAAFQPVAAIPFIPPQAVIVPAPLETAAGSATGEIQAGLALSGTSPAPAAIPAAPPPGAIPSSTALPAGTLIVPGPSFAASAARRPLPLPWAAQPFLPFDLALAQTQHWSWDEVSLDNWDDGGL